MTHIVVGITHSTNNKRTHYKYNSVNDYRLKHPVLDEFVSHHDLLDVELGLVVQALIENALAQDHYIALTINKFQST